MLNHKKHSGFTLMEIIITLAIISILVGLGFTKLNGLSNPLTNAIGQTEAILKQARVKAMATTSATYIFPDINATSATFVVWRIPDCSQVSLDKVPDGYSDPRWSEDTTFNNLELPKEVSFAQTNWKLCLNSRGLATLINFSGIIGLNYSKKGQSAEVQIYAGGGVLSR